MLFLKRNIIFTLFFIFFPAFFYSVFYNFFLPWDNRCLQSLDYSRNKKYCFGWAGIPKILGR